MRPRIVISDIGVFSWWGYRCPRRVCFTTQFIVGNSGPIRAWSFTQWHRTTTNRKIVNADHSGKIIKKFSLIVYSEKYFDCYFAIHLPGNTFATSVSIFQASIHGAFGGPSHLNLLCSLLNIVHANATISSSTKMKKISISNYILKQDIQLVENHFLKHQNWRNTVHEGHKDCNFEFNACVTRVEIRISQSKIKLFQFYPRLD